MMPFLSRHALPCFLAGAVFAIAPSHGTADTEDRATAQTLYVPSYSRVLTNDGDSQPLASTLVVHNVDAKHRIEITRIDYYDRTGQLLKAYLDEPIELGPFESTSALVPLGSIGDGIGANFIVTWSATSPALPPVVEAIMVGGIGTQGISFTSIGRVISEEK